MNFSLYRQTNLEQWINDHYQKDGIVSPGDLDISRIAALFGVELRYDACKSFSDNVEGVIILDKRKTSVSSRMIFFHELCHVLRHYGDQRQMPELFKEGQEAEANVFLLYASMPIYLIERLTLPTNQNEAINYLSFVFQVPMKHAKQRLDQIHRRLYDGGLMHSYIKINNENSKFQMAPPANNIETAIYAYYDSSWECTDPSQFVVQVDQHTLLNQEEFTFSLDGPFNRIEDNQLEAFVDSKPIQFNDLDYTIDGRISLRLSHLASRYYNSAYRFVIQKKDIEELLRFHGDEF